MKQVELFNDHFQNFKVYGIPKAQLIIADLAGALGVDFTKMQPCRYYRAFGKFSFTENAFALCKGLSKDAIGIEKRIQFGLDYVFNWAHYNSIDLAAYIEAKMRYNIMRPIRHGKKY